MFYRSSKDADQVAESLEKEFKGQSFKAIQCDVTDQAKVNEAFEKVVELFKGGLHGVVAVSRGCGCYVPRGCSSKVVGVDRFVSLPPSIERRCCYRQRRPRSWGRRV
jgi:NAD(P)-dependent dehydrogenase (short-subunit alcohol dehydrogenase family)